MPIWIVPRVTHCVRFPGTSLTIAEDTDFAAVHGAFCQGLNGLEDCAVPFVFVKYLFERVRRRDSLVEKFDSLQMGNFRSWHLFYIGSWGILRRAISMRTETAKHNSERVSTALSLVLLRQIGQLEALAFSVANPRNPTRPPVRRVSESAKPGMRRRYLGRPQHLDLSHLLSILPGVVKACYMLIVFLYSSCPLLAV